MLLLGIETSCDDTSLSLFDEKRGIIFEISQSQAHLHNKYKGIVPELCSREHLKNLFPLLDILLKESDKKMEDITHIAITTSPGLILSLVVGVSFGKALSFLYNKPIIPVHHIEGHIYSSFLEEKREYPFLALVISGGHTELYLVKDFEEYHLLGKTKDDAAGEAFDKVATMLGLSYPGGPSIEKFLENYLPQTKIDFPSVNIPNYDFSFSGIKTFTKALIEKNNYNKKDIAFYFQENIILNLWKKLYKAVIDTNVKNVVVVGGVSANKRLRDFLSKESRELGLNIYLPPKKYSTDNASMIAYAGYLRAKRYQDKSFNLVVEPSISLESFIKNII